MAEETKTTSTRGRKPKAKVEEVKIEKDAIDLELEQKYDQSELKKDDQSELIKQLMAQIEAQNKAMAELQSKINTQPTIMVQKESNLGGKKIKCINLMHSVVNISTEPDGLGRVYTFEKYGDYKMIKFDDLSDIVSSYPYTMENGLIYISDREAVEELGLSEEYDKLYTKERMDRVVYLREQSDVDIFLGMEKNMQESTAMEIAKLMNLNERMDYNYLREIKERTGIDIEQVAKDLKENERKPE